MRLQRTENSMDANYVGEKRRSKENHHGDGHEEDGRSSFNYVNLVMRV